MKFKLGRNRPKFQHRKSSFREMLNAGVLPSVTVPDETCYRRKAKTSLGQMYCNDLLGDCVIAGGGHARGLTSFNGGKGKRFTDQEIIQQYSAIGGYDPSQTQPDGSNPTDNGCDEVTAINYWEQTGFPDGVKILKSVSVDATNPTEFRLAQFLFENIFFGVELPDAWVNPMPDQAGFVWDAAGPPNPNNGHAFVGADIVPEGILLSTWGMWGIITPAAMAKYATEAAGGNLFCLLLPDVVNRLTQKSPAGYTLDALQEYLDHLTLPTSHTNQDLSTP